MTLSTPDKSGVTRREYLAQAEAQTGQTLLEEPEPPEGGEILWAWYFELHGGRQGTGFGPAPLSWGDMRHWAALTSTPLKPWHVHILRAMDDAYLAAVHTQSKKNRTQ